MNIAIIAGSNRNHSTSTSVLRYMERSLLRRTVSVDFIDLRLTKLPYFSPDAEMAHPEVERLRQVVRNASGIIFGTPEFHGSVSGLLKNAIDHLDNDIVAGKPVLGVSAAGGPLGVSSLTHLQAMVRNLHGHFCPEWISVGGDNRYFDENGKLLDEGLKQRIEGALDRFVELAQVLEGASLSAT
jgi:NAD(P)H-dependent FMN reductase